jgi:hypothetical protein
VSAVARLVAIAPFSIESLQPARGGGVVLPSDTAPDVVAVLDDLVLEPTATEG